MESYEQIFFAFFDVDLSRDQPIKLEVKENDIPNFIEELIQEINGKEDRVRSYCLQRESTEVFSNLIKLLNDDLDSDAFSMIVANRLHEAEKTTQDKIKHLQKIKKGSLVQIVLKNNETGEYQFIVAKVEDNDFLDKKTLLRRVGPPYKDSALKFCKHVFSDMLELIDIYIYDSNPKVSDYWYQGFLELREARNDEHNTKQAFNSVKTVLDRNLKRQFPQDYNILKDATINYFRSQEIFEYEEFLENVFKGYEPENSDLDMNRIITKFRELPERNDFDRSFKPVPKEIKSRISRKYAVSDKIDLTLKDSIDNLKETIRSYEDSEGKKFLRVRVQNESTFEQFNFKKK